MVEMPYEEETLTALDGFFAKGISFVPLRTSSPP
jgi:hypothetical protein